jgi:hypothetical protein
MERRRSPQENKELDYERQHFTLGKSNKGFRKKWPKKKAIAERQFRHKIANTLARGSDMDSDDLQSEVLSCRRKHVGKWGVPNLRELIEHKKAKRLGRVGGKKRRMERLLSSMTNQYLEESRRLARLQEVRAAVERRAALRVMRRTWSKSSGVVGSE